MTAIKQKAIIFLKEFSFFTQYQNIGEGKFMSKKNKKTKEGEKKDTNEND